MITLIKRKKRRVKKRNSKVGQYIEVKIVLKVGINVTSLIQGI